MNSNRLEFEIDYAICDFKIGTGSYMDLLSGAVAITSLKGGSAVAVAGTL